MSDERPAAVCVSMVWSTGKPCTHKAKYVWPLLDWAVCGVHARGLLRCVPIEDEYRPRRAGIHSSTVAEWAVTPDWPPVSQPEHARLTALLKEHDGSV